jgi:hypothetical protein
MDKYKFEIPQFSRNLCQKPVSRGRDRGGVLIGYSIPALFMKARASQSLHPDRHLSEVEITVWAFIGILFALIALFVWVFVQKF